MKVLYDIAVLGLGHRQERARTGIFRVVENVALELSRSTELSLGFCATAVPAGCQAYLRSRPILSEVPLRSATARVALDKLELSLIDAAARAKPGWTVGRVARGCVGFALHQVRRRLPALSDADLADAQIFHSPFYPLPESTRGKRGLRRFLTIYDLIPLVRPDLFEANVVKLMNEIIGSLSAEDHVVCISEATRRDLLSFRSDIDPSHVKVTHLAAADHFRPDLRPEDWPSLKRKYGLPDQPFALTLSTLEPRKNIAHVIRCYARLVAENKVGDLRLVMVGTKGWKMESIFAELDRLGPISQRVIVTGFVPDEDLAPIYSHAAMFLYPSLLEGFGLPPLEAMQCGVPVITSNTSSLPEVVGDAGIQVDPRDEESLCRAIVSLLDNREEHDRLATQGRERAATFSWARCAEETIEAYRSALNTE